MEKYFKYIRDIIFILFFIRLTFIENHPIYLLFETLFSLIYLFVPNNSQSKQPNSTDIIE